MRGWQHLACGFGVLGSSGLGFKVKSQASLGLRDWIGVYQGLFEVFKGHYRV